MGLAVYAADITGIRLDRRNLRGRSWQKKMIRKKTKNRQTRF